MAKEEQNENKKHNIRNKLNKTSRSSEPNINADANGTPLDRIQYVEAKLILKPDRFTSARSFRKFGKIVKRVAKRVGVGFIKDKRARLPPEIREVVFFDTPDFRLYNKAFILRRRISYLDGFPVGDPEIVLKFRHVDEAKARKMDLHPKIAGKYRIKFKSGSPSTKGSSGRLPSSLFTQLRVRLESSTRRAPDQHGAVVPGVSSANQAERVRQAKSDGGQRRHCRGSTTAACATRFW
jgi:hypothetical protein